MNKNLRKSVGGLAFGRGNAKARTGNKLSNSRKTFREQTPSMTPNRLLGAVLLSIAINMKSVFTTFYTLK